jgi:hypothetical protein
LETFSTSLRGRQLPLSLANVILTFDFKDNNRVITFSKERGRKEGSKGYKERARVDREGREAFLKGKDQYS